MTDEVTLSFWRGGFGLRLLLGLFFLYAGFVKLMDVPRFADNVADFGIIADRWVPIAAWGTCFVEILTGSAVILRLQGGLLAMGSLLIVFVGILSYGLWLGLDVDCGCLGAAHQLNLPTQLGLDVSLLAACCLAGWLDRRAGIHSRRWNTRINRNSARGIS